MFSVVNEGQAIKHTDYWQSEQARSGYLFLSWDAGAARLLVPDASEALLKEIRGAQYVIISKGEPKAVARWNSCLKTAAMHRSWCTCFWSSPIACYRRLKRAETLW